MTQGVVNWLTQHPDQANALAAIANVIVAALALGVAVTSILFAYFGLRLQRRHNHLSVMPIPVVALADFEDKLRVKVRNDGVGTLIVNSIEVLLNGTKQHAELVSYMPDLPPGIYWTNFSSGYVRSIPANGEQILLELELDLTKQHHAHFREECRKALAGLVVVVYFTDIYGNSFEPATRDLDWFNRRLASSRTVK